MKNEEGAWKQTRESTGDLSPLVSEFIMSGNDDFIFFRGKELVDPLWFWLSFACFLLTVPRSLAVHPGKIHDMKTRQDKTRPATIGNARHFRTCPKVARDRLHNKMRDELLLMCRAAGIPVQKEPLHLLPDEPRTPIKTWRSFHSQHENRWFHPYTTCHRFHRTIYWRQLAQYTTPSTRKTLKNNWNWCGGRFSSQSLGKLLIRIPPKNNSNARTTSQWRIAVTAKALISGPYPLKPMVALLHLSTHSSKSSVTQRERIQRRTKLLSCTTGAHVWVANSIRILPPYQCKGLQASDDTFFDAQHMMSNFCIFYVLPPHMELPVSKSRRFQPYPSTTTDKTRNTVNRC